MIFKSLNDRPFPRHCLYPQYFNDHPTFSNSLLHLSRGETLDEIQNELQDFSDDLNLRPIFPLIF